MSPRGPWRVTCGRHSFASALLFSQPLSVYTLEPMSGLAIQELQPSVRALRGALAERVVIADGAMGTMLQASDATPDDFDGLEGCNEMLNVTRPDIVRGMHRAYLAAGADCVTTNTFGANLGNLERVRDNRAHRRAVAGRRAPRPRRRRRVHRRGRAAPLGARLDRPGHQAAHPRPRHVPRAARLLLRERGRPAARRRRRADHRDLPGPAPGEGGDHRGKARGGRPGAGRGRHRVS